MPMLQHFVTNYSKVTLKYTNNAAIIYTKMLIFSAQLWVKTSLNAFKFIVKVEWLEYSFGINLSL